LLTCSIVNIVTIIVANMKYCNMIILSAVAKTTTKVSSR